MSNEKAPRRARPVRKEAGDTSEVPEVGNFSDPRVRWPDKEWQKTEQPGGDRPPERRQSNSGRAASASRPSAGRRSKGAAAGKPGS